MKIIKNRLIELFNGRRKKGTFVLVTPNLNSQCSVCEGNRLVAVQPALELAYLRCLSCGFEQQEIENNTLSESFEKAQTLHYEEDDLMFTKTVRAINWHRAGVRLKVVKKHFQSGRLLEIGPGMGEFLQQASQQGLLVEAVETAKRFAKYLREDLKIKTYESTLEDLNLEGKQYDALYSSHVIEHVVDPVLYLSTAKKYVKPGGLFFIMTPNGDCWEHQLVDRAWSMYSKAHLHIFTAPSLKICLQKAGWEVKDVETPEYSEDWIRAIVSFLFNRKPKSIPPPGKNIRRLPEWLTIAILRTANVFLSPLALVQSSRKKGGELFVIAQRPLAE